MPSGLHNLDVFKRRYDAGEQLELVRIIRHCAKHGLVIPDWAAKAFVEAVDDVLTGRKDSWDAALGRPLLKGRQLAAARKRVRLLPQVFKAVIEAKASGKAIDRGLFENIGKPLGLSGSLAEQYYYSLTGPRSSSNKNTKRPAPKKFRKVQGIQDARR